MEKNTWYFPYVCLCSTLYICFTKHILKKYESLFYSRKLDELFGGWKGSRGIGQY